MLLGGGEPHPVVCRLVKFVAQDEDNLVLNLVTANIDGEAAEHGVSPGRQRSERVKHEFMWNRLALLDRKQGVVQREEPYCDGASTYERRIALRSLLPNR